MSTMVLILAVIPLLCITVYILAKLLNAYKNKNVWIEKKHIVKTCINAVEYFHSDLPVQERYNKAEENISLWIINRNFVISDIELKMLMDSVYADRTNHNEKSKKENFNETEL